MYNDIIREMKDYAKENSVPIMTDSGINFLENYIRQNNIKRILEVGTAIGYSAIRMAMLDPDIYVTTIEKDEKRYLEAVKNVKKAGLESRIHLIYNDALTTKVDDSYELIFIDAAKAQNQRIFERFEANLTDDGVMITDNMKFHGLVDKDLEEIESKNLRQLVRKVKEYTQFLKGNVNYETEFLDVGDGISISRKVN